MILFEINNPKPVPLFEDLVTNAVKSFGYVCGCMPVPVSFILTRISFPFLSTITVILPSFVKFNALDKRLQMT